MLWRFKPSRDQNRERQRQKEREREREEFELKLSTLVHAIVTRWYLKSWTSEVVISAVFQLTKEIQLCRNTSIILEICILEQRFPRNSKKKPDWWYTSLSLPLSVSFSFSLSEIRVRGGTIFLTSEAWNSAWLDVIIEQRNEAKCSMRFFQQSSYSKCSLLASHASWIMTRSAVPSAADFQAEEIIQTWLTET